MKRNMLPLVAGLALVMTPALAHADVALARSEAAKPAATRSIAIVEPWVREAPPGASVVGAYMILRNPSPQADRLLSVRSPLAETVEIHRMTVKNGMMDMEAIPFLTIPAQGEVKLQPGGKHLMIYGLKQDLREGDRLPLELKFEHSGTRMIDAPVRKVMGRPHH